LSAQNNVIGCPGALMLDGSANMNSEVHIDSFTIISKVKNAPSSHSSLDTTYKRIYPAYERDNGIGANLYAFLEWIQMVK
jgi:hypothetical protein